jgi:hypothetical protein
MQQLTPGEEIQNEGEFSLHFTFKNLKDFNPFGGPCDSAKLSR